MAGQILITDAETMIAAGSTATTLANAINPAKQIQDMPGHQKLLWVHLVECLNLMKLMVAVTDPGDPNYTVLNNDITQLGVPTLPFP